MNNQKTKYFRSYSTWTKEEENKLIKDLQRCSCDSWFYAEINKNKGLTNKICEEISNRFFRTPRAIKLRIFYIAYKMYYSGIPKSEIINQLFISEEQLTEIINNNKPIKMQIKTSNTSQPQINELDKSLIELKTEFKLFKKEVKEEFKDIKNSFQHIANMLSALTNITIKNNDY